MAVARFGNFFGGLFMLLVDEQLQKHVAGLTSSSGTTDIRHLFNLDQVSGFYVTLDSHIRDLETLTDDFFFRGFAHRHNGIEQAIYENNSHYKKIRGICQLTLSYYKDFYELRFIPIFIGI